MKTVIKTLAIAGVGHFAILNATTAIAAIARNEKVQDTKIGKFLYDAMSAVSSVEFVHSVIVNPAYSQEEVSNFYAEHLIAQLENCFE